MFDIVMYRGVNTALITTITWVILRIVMGEVVCTTETTHIVGQHNPLVFAVYIIQKFLVHTTSLGIGSVGQLINESRSNWPHPSSIIEVSQKYLLHMLRR